MSEARVASSCRVVVSRTCQSFLAPPYTYTSHNMSGFDANRVYSVSVHDTADPTSPETASQTEKLLLDFLLQYRVGGEFIYR